MRPYSTPSTVEEAIISLDEVKKELQTYYDLTKDAEEKLAEVNECLKAGMCAQLDIDSLKVERESLLNEYNSIQHSVSLIRDNKVKLDKLVESDRKAYEEQAANIALKISKLSEQEEALKSSISVLENVQKVQVELNKKLEEKNTLLQQDNIKQIDINNFLEKENKELVEENNKNKASLVSTKLLVKDQAENLQQLKLSAESQKSALKEQTDHFAIVIATSNEKIENLKLEEEKIAKDLADRIKAVEEREGNASIIEKANETKKQQLRTIKAELEKHFNSPLPTLII